MGELLLFGLVAAFGYLAGHVRAGIDLRREHAKAVVGLMMAHAKAAHAEHAELVELRLWRDANAPRLRRLGPLTPDDGIPYWVVHGADWVCVDPGLAGEAMAEAMAAPSKIITLHRSRPRLTD